MADVMEAWKVKMVKETVRPEVFQFEQQMQMMEQNLAKQTGMQMKLAPSQHPKFQEEWLKVQTELDGQYGKAIDQYKGLIEQRLIL